MKRVLMSVALIAACSVPSMVAQAATKTWTDGTGDWGVAGNWNGGTEPLAGDVVNIALADRIARTVTYDVPAPNLGVLSIDLTGPGATASTLSLPAGNNLSTSGLVVGGFNGAVVTNGRGVVEQSAGTVTTSPGTGDLILGWGAGSTGVYTLSGGALVNSLNEYVGLAGTGTFNHSGGTNVINANATGSLSLGTNAGSTGIYNLGGTGVLSTATDQTVGNSGFGVFTHTGGTNTIVGATHRLYIARNPGSFGGYKLSGNASLASTDVIVGNNGIGELTIQDQASANITNNLSINNISTVSLNGGTLRFNTIGGTGGLSRLNYNAGTVQLAGNRTIGADAAIATLFPTIPSGKRLVVEGATTNIETNFSVNGGRLETNALQLAFGGTNRQLTITNGGTVASSNGQIAFGLLNTPPSQGNVIVSGAGSAWNVADFLIVGGFWAQGEPGDSYFSALTIEDEALVHVGGEINIRSNGIINLNGGTLRFDDLKRGGNFGGPADGVFNFNAGTIQLSANRNVGADAAIADLFGMLPVIPAGKALAVEGIATLSKPLTIAGGRFKANALVISAGGALDFDRGVLELTSGPISGLASLTVPSNGEFRASTLQALRVTGAAGSTITATGHLTLGDGLAVNGFATQGTLQVGAYRVTLLDANDAVLDSMALVTLGSGGSPGTLATTSLTLDFGGNITGFGTVETANSMTQPFINNGHITGESVASPITLTGYVKGVGTLDNVNITGTFAPGLSPTVLVAGNVAFAPASTLQMELGGITPGSGYDQILSSGALAFDGTLMATLIDGFAPAAGQSFNLFDSSTVSGRFAALQLPALAGGLAWDTSQLYTNGLLTVTSADPGDFDQDGDVDGQDFLIWQRGGSPDPISSNDLTTWQANFGLAAADPVLSAVPEPAGLALALAAVGVLLSRRLASRRRAG